MIEEIDALEKNKKEFLRLKQQNESELRYNYDELIKIEEELVKRAYSLINLIKCYNYLIIILGNSKKRSQLN